MPSTSEKQRKAMAIALAAKRGEIPESKLKGPAKKMERSMSEGQLHDFAKKVAAYGTPQIQSPANSVGSMASTGKVSPTMPTTAGVTPLSAASSSAQPANTTAPVKQPQNATDNVKQADDMNSLAPRDTETPSKAIVEKKEFEGKLPKYKDTGSPTANVPDAIVNTPVGKDDKTTISSGDIPGSPMGVGKEATVNPLVYFMMPREVKQAFKLNPEGLASGEPEKARKTIKKNPEQLRMGEKVEHEHVASPDKAKAIAADHLVEDPEYYTHLKAMEDTVKRSSMEIDELVDGLMKQALAPAPVMKPIQMGTVQGGATMPRAVQPGLQPNLQQAYSAMNNISLTPPPGQTQTPPPNWGPRVQQPTEQPQQSVAPGRQPAVYTPANEMYGDAERALAPVNPPKMNDQEPVQKMDMSAFAPEPAQHTAPHTQRPAWASGLARNTQQLNAMGGGLARSSGQIARMGVKHAVVRDQAVKSIVDFVSSTPNLDDATFDQFIASKGYDPEMVDQALQQHAGNTVAKSAGLQQAFANGVAQIVKKANLTPEGLSRLTTVLEYMAPEFSNGIGILKQALVGDSTAGREKPKVMGNPQVSETVQAMGDTTTPAQRFMKNKAMRELKNHKGAKRGVIPHPQDVFGGLGNRLAIKQVADRLGTSTQSDPVPVQGQISG